MEVLVRKKISSGFDKLKLLVEYYKKGYMSVTRSRSTHT